MQNKNANVLINYLINQSARPSGFVGSIITRIWSSYFQNLGIWNTTLVRIDKSDVILDVGFGGGAIIKELKNQYNNNVVYGIDISDESLKTATIRNQKYVDSGTVILSQGDVEKLPYYDKNFNLIFACQTHIFWKQLKTGLTECYRVLKKNGMFIISCEKYKIEYHLSKYKESSVFSDLLYEVGFCDVMIKEDNQYIAFLCTK